MCGRFAVGTPSEAAWADWLGAPVPRDRPPPSWNVAPTDTALVLGLGRDGERRLAPARWGLIPHWWKKPLSEMKATTFNARSEEAAEKPMFRAAWARGRCLVPALGYFEWSGKAGAKQPWFVTQETNAPGIAFAGLAAKADLPGPDGPETIRSCTILTCAAGEATRHLHPREPVVLPESAWEQWLSGGEAGALMRAAEPARVRLWPVGKAVGNARAEGPELIERVGPALG